MKLTIEGVDIHRAYSMLNRMVGEYDFDLPHKLGQKYTFERDNESIQFTRKGDVFDLEYCSNVWNVFWFWLS